jgi:hypothetical protein
MQPVEVQEKEAEAPQGLRLVEQLGLPTEEKLDPPLEM